MQRKILFCGLAAALVSSTLVRAEDFGPSNMPDVVAREIRASSAQCARPKFDKGFVNRRDVNGDGIEDLYLDFTHYTCDGTPDFCGSGGCSLKLFVSSQTGYRKVYDDTVQEFSFSNTGGTPRMTLDLHGSYCNKAGSEPCHKVLAWNGNRFEAAGAAPPVMSNVQGGSHPPHVVKMPPIKYSVQRVRMFAEGYTPVTSHPNGGCSAGREDVCRKYSETESCSGTGMGYCTFTWEHNGKIIEIVTAGELLDQLTTVSSRSCGATRC